MEFPLYYGHYPKYKSLDYANHINIYNQIINNQTQ